MGADIDGKRELWEKLCGMGGGGVQIIAAKNQTPS